MRVTGIRTAARAIAFQLNLTIFAAAGATAVHAQETDWTALTRDADVKLSFRYRYEAVDDDNFSRDAEASTLRTRLSLTSGEVNGFSGFVEFDDVHQIGPDNYNAGAGNTPSHSDYPVIADPEGTEVNQAYVDYTRGGWLVRLGRQRINFDNQRFVGGVGWRQNEQTFDAVKLNYKHDHFDASYAYVNKVQRIFGDDVPAGTHDQDGTHLLNVNSDLDGIGKLSGYYYRLDNEDAAAFSSATIGARLTGKRQVRQSQNGDIAMRYTAEFARQRDAGDNPADYSANYWNLEAGVLFDAWDLGVGWEVLDGDENSPGEAFRTPMATLHAFNGWADRFLNTPDAGLDDKYVKAKFGQRNVTAQLIYHRFDAADGGAEFGDEIDFMVGYKFSRIFRADLKYARFSGEDGVQDVFKLWLVLSAAL